MRKYWIVFVALLLSLTACAASGNEGGDVALDEQEYFNKETTGNERDNLEDLLCSALKGSDATVIANLFSEQLTLDDTVLLEQAEGLCEYIQGDVLSFSLVAGPVTTTTEDSEKHEEVQEASYALKTSTQEYYVALRWIAVNNSAPNASGITSLYIIEKSNWDKSYAYWGDNLWTCGINIVHSAV